MATYNTPKVTLAQNIASQDIETRIKLEVDHSIAKYYGFESPEDLRKEYNRVRWKLRDAKTLVDKHFLAKNDRSLIRTMNVHMYAIAVNLDNQVTKKFKDGEEVTGEIVYIDDELYLEIIEGQQYIPWSRLRHPDILSNSQLDKKMHLIKKHNERLIELRTVFFDDWNVNGKYLFNQEQLALNDQLLFLPSA